MNSDMSTVFSRPPRTIVLCFDGTNGQYSDMNTNVVKFFGLLNKNSPDQQVAYYQAGIGTYFAPGVVSPLFTSLACLVDEAVAWYLDAHVMAGYRFLMANYRTGDKICLFGFSRGAYTARALAGMLTRVGLLPKDNLQQVGFAYKAYTRTDKESAELAAGFKKTFSQDVKIEFVGVWDTVQSTGMLINRVLPFTNTNSAIKVFRHALSLDEHRSRFRPDLYHWPVLDDAGNGVVDVESVRRRFDPKSIFERLLKRKYAGVQSTQGVGPGPSTEGNQPHDPNGTQPQNEGVDDELFTTDVLEVWFAGCHSDIGGGNVQDDVEVSLAQITLRWMVEHAIQSQCGILFDSQELARIGITAPLSPRSSPTSNNDLPLVASEERPRDIKDGSAMQESPNQPNQHTPGPDSDREHSDAIAPLFDELVINKAWWILEFLPFTYTWQDHNTKWHTQWSLNLGRPRVIPCKEPRFHHTVKERMDYKPLKYEPRAIHDHDVIYV